MIKIQTRHFIETLENNETNSGHKHNAHMYSSRLQKHLYDESTLSRFEVPTKHLYKCNEDRPHYATQYKDNFIQYKEGFNDGPPSLTPYTKASIRDGYVIPQE